MSNAYIQIYTPDQSNSYKFGAVAGQWTRIFDKAIALARTIGGGLDIAMGSVYQTDMMILKVRATEDRAGYGTRENLEDLYKYNRPGNNVLRVTDHYGNTLYVKFTGRFNQRSITTTIEGSQAWYHIACEFTVMPDYYRKLMALAPDDIVALIPLWDPSGSVASDVGGNDYDGVIGATHTLDQDGIGDGRRSILSNDGSIDLAAIEPGLDYTEGTIFLWVKPPTAGFTAILQYLVEIYVDANNYLRLTVDGSGDLETLAKAGGTGGSRTKSSPGTAWQMLGLTWGGGDARMYWNGAINGALWTIGTWAGTPGTLFLGATVADASPTDNVYMAYFGALTKKLDATEMAEAYDFAR